MSCADIRAALASFDTCDETPDGSRVTTHCLYPSFEPVYVFVAKYGDGFKVHDGGGAFKSAWDHGRDENAICRAINTEARRFHLGVLSNSILAEVKSIEWLPSAIIGVANASARASYSIVAKFVREAEVDLVDRIDAKLKEIFGVNRFKRDVEIVGRSGGRRHFDFAIEAEEHEVLINGVAPHKGSISSKYVAFADAEGDQLHKIAVYDRDLDTDDIALLQQVAVIMPLGAVPYGAREAVKRLR